MPRYELPLSHRPNRDGSTVTSAHVPYFLALEVMAQAWALAIDGACGPLLAPGDLGVVHVTSDFSREAFVGTAVVDVHLRRIGSSSLTFALELGQAGQQVATATAVVAQVDETRTHSVPLSAEQRTALQPLAGR